MTDSLVAQREARRQKLMKNAENRMNRLRARPPSATNGNNNEFPSSDIELQTVDLKEDVGTGYDRTNQDENKETIVNSSYNLRHRTRAVFSKSEEGTQESILSDENTQELSSSSIPYKIVEDPEVPSLAEFLVKQEATKTAGDPNSCQGTFDPSMPHLPLKRPYSDTNGQSREKQLERMRVIGLFLTALLSRWCLSYDIDIGFFFFKDILKSMFFPLVLFEIFIVYAVRKYMQGVSLAPPQGSLLTTALMLCGVRLELVQLYIGIMARVTALSNDLFLYLFAFLVWHIVLVSLY